MTAIFAEAVQTLREEVATFFDRASSGELEYNFIVGTVVEPDISWDTVNLRYLNDHLPKINQNPCFIEARNHALTEDVPGVGRYGNRRRR